jgi:predicted nucleic-acid-binding protein
MKALDTNVLVRFLVRDDELQAEIIYRKFKKIEASKEVLFVPILVIIETIWVLESVYDVSRQEILDSIEDLLLMPILKFEAQPMLRSFVSSARELKVELSDLLIAQSARFSGCDNVLTFDKRAAASGLFELLK